MVSLEDWDPKQEQQVWQRVFAPPRNSPREDLRGLQLAAMELSALYRHLSGGLTGKKREMSRRLFQGEQANLACLRGMCRLSGMEPGRDKAMAVPKMEAEKLLELCFHKTRRAMAEYTARSVDPEFGEVFRKMARRAGDHCAILAELLGDGAASR